MHQWMRDIRRVFLCVCLCVCVCASVVLKQEWYLYWYTCIRVCEPATGCVHIRIVSAGNDAAATIVKAYYGDQLANDNFLACYNGKLRSRSLHVKLWSNQILNVFPLSVGLLKADGLLRVALCLEGDVQIQEEESLSTYRSKWYQEEKNAKSLDDLFCPLCISPLPAIENPKVKVFCAKNGDSALFSWNTWNVLIDGGLTYAKDNPPCFCNEIRKLNKLDLVVLTHGDADHVNRLLPLKKKSLMMF